MKTKKQLKIRVTAADAAMPSKAKLRAKRSKKSPSVASRVQPNGADKVAKFKDEIHLNTETRDLGQNEVEPDAEKAVPLSSTSKKRHRRSAAEIDRKYKCPFTGCLKAYGSEGSLIHHQKLKHPERVDRKDKDNQVGTFLLPLHNAPRNVMIRPATPLVALATDRKLLLSNHSTNDMNALGSPLDIVPLSAKALRRNMRSRSNSDPVALIEEQASPKVCIPPAVLMTKLLPKNPRKSRRVVTPHVKKTATIARRTKLRSKSESLPEMNPFQSLNELKIPSYYRSDSSASAHETVLPISCTGSVEHGPFEWPAALISASGHHSTSLSSDEQAIDSDILSVLANCDEEQSRDSSGINFGGGPPLTESYQSSTRYEEIKNTDMLPVGMKCFKIAENATLPTQVSEGLVINEPEAELGLKAFATLGEDWTNALLLSDHLQKMSVAQGDTPPHSLVSTFGKVMPSVETVHRLCSASDGVHVLPGLSHFSSVPLDTFSVNTTSQLRGKNGLAGQHNFQPCTTKAAKMEGGSQQMLWLSGEADVASVSHTQPSSVSLDQLLRHDDTLEWKPTDIFEDDKEGESVLADTGMTPTLL